MDASDEEKSHNIKNGHSIIGKVGQYQEKYGGSEKEIKSLSYLYYIIKMLDTPAPDYTKNSNTNKKKTTKKKKQKLGFGTPIKELSSETQNLIRK